MDKKFETYLDRIGMPAPLKERVDELLKLYGDYCPEPINSVFVTDHIDEEGKRLYDNLWFISENYVMELQSFIKKTNIDLLNTKSIIHFHLDLENNEEDQINDKLKALLTIYITEYFVARISGTGQNVPAILELLKGYFIPRIISGNP